MCNLYLMYYTKWTKKDQVIVCGSAAHTKLPALPYSSLVPLRPNPDLEEYALGKSGRLGYTLPVSLPYFIWNILSILFHEFILSGAANKVFGRTACQESEVCPRGYQSHNRSSGIDGMNQASCHWKEFFIHCSCHLHSHLKRLIRHSETALQPISMESSYMLETKLFWQGGRTVGLKDWGDNLNFTVVHSLKENAYSLSWTNQLKVWIKSLGFLEPVSQRQSWR